jgi:hypothetical protein
MSGESWYKSRVNSVIGHIKKSDVAASLSDLGAD